MQTLHDLDQSIQDLDVQRFSLSPEKITASSFSEIFRIVFAEQTKDSSSEPLFQLYFETSASLFQSISTHFPENIFWDLDFLLNYLFHKSSPLGQDIVRIKDTKNLILAIFSQFGIQSRIKFRYIHDFVYGYDWLKWTREKRKPEEDPHPFGFSFLNYILQRGKELELLIEKNDANYPDLKGEFRNPFFFSRSDKEEALLLKHLSIHHLVPIDAWDFQAQAKSDRNYSLLRLEKAIELGIESNKMLGSHKV